jgi:hypothetical protein
MCAGERVRCDLVLRLVRRANSNLQGRMRFVDSIFGMKARRTRLAKRRLDRPNVIQDLSSRGYPARIAEGSQPLRLPSSLKENEQRCRFSLRNQACRIWSAAASCRFVRAQPAAPQARTQPRVLHSWLRLCRAGLPCPASTESPFDPASPDHPNEPCLCPPGIHFQTQRVTPNASAVDNRTPPPVSLAIDNARLSISINDAYIHLQLRIDFLTPFCYTSSCSSVPKSDLLRITSLESTLPRNS